MKHVSWPKIGQLNQVVREVSIDTAFVGLDEDFQPIYDGTIPKPKIKFTGTVKLHGTNAGVSFNKEDGLWVQSRENIITLTQDNAGFAFYISTVEEQFKLFFSEAYEKFGLSDDHTLTIFGEWAGAGIQKNVAISQLPKAFYVFGLKVSKEDAEFTNYYLDASWIKSPSSRIYNVFDFPTYEIEIDFNDPKMAQNTLIKITEDVEKQCPIAKALGVEGLGEGVVWTGQHKDNIYRFKVKGEEHSVTKVKTLAPVDTEKLESIKAFVDYAVTENRLDQAIEKVGGSEMSYLGDIIRWMINDIITEETHTLAENGLEPKTVNGEIAKRTRLMFLTKISEGLNV